MPVPRAAPVSSHPVLPTAGFPSDETLRQKWIIAVKRKDWEPTKFSKLCSAHFREEDIDRTSLSCVRIRQGAVPQIFSESNVNLLRTLATREIAKTIRAAGLTEVFTEPYLQPTVNSKS
ncbi:hypothetical protein J6590_008758 [Homalodisca vitripennis]|nr:hypothetical protein J6590_008758 [Homalodisca vitripennis]